MKLYDAQGAPSPRRVRMFLAEKGIEVPTEQVDLKKKQQLSAEYLRKCPTATVPALELDDGTVINQIPAICLYIEEAHPHPSLMGIDPKDKALIAMWDRRMELEGYGAVVEVRRNSSSAMKDRALPGPHKIEQIPELVERGKKRYRNFLGDLDARLGESEFIAGGRFTIADISALVTIDFATRLDLPGPVGYGNLERWYEAVSSRPSAEA